MTLYNKWKNILKSPWYGNFVYENGFRAQIIYDDILNVLPITFKARENVVTSLPNLFILIKYLILSLAYKEIVVVFICTYLVSIDLMNL